MKNFLLSFFEFITSIIMWIPIRKLRIFWLKIFGLKAGKDVWIFRNVEIRRPNKIIIGSHSKINKCVLLDGRGGEIKIGENVDIAQDCKIWTLEHDPNSDLYATKGGAVEIEDFCWLASNVTVLPGVKIHRGAVVATGAVVTKDVDSMTIVAGIPARKIGERTSKLNYQLGKSRPFFK